MSNVSAWCAKSGVANYCCYCAGKAALLAFTRSRARELASAGVTANAICPGTIVNTRMRDQVDERNRLTGNPTAKERESVIPLAWVAQPQDMAGVAAFLTGPAARSKTVEAPKATGGRWMAIIPLWPLRRPYTLYTLEGSRP